MGLTQVQHADPARTQPKERFWVTCQGPTAKSLWHSVITNRLKWLVTASSLIVCTAELQTL